MVQIVSFIKERVERISMSAWAAIEDKSFNGKILQKWFSNREFYVTIADADIESFTVKSLLTLFGKYLETTNWQIGAKSYDLKYTTFWAVNKKWFTIFDKHWHHFGRRSVTETIVWCLFMWRLSSFSVLKIFIRYSDTCNQIKSCTKHVRSNQS